VYKCKKLSSYFNLKDATNKSHKHTIVYKYTCPGENCSTTYIGETGRRLSERVKDHQYRDKKSHILKHSESLDHPRHYKNILEL